jgi:Tfp pilus assembly protein PilF
MKNFILTIVLILSLFFIAVSVDAQEKNIKPFAKDAVEKGWAYFDKGDLETALKRFHHATIIDSQFAPGYFGKAYVYSVQDKLDAAIENYHLTIKWANPPFSPAYANLGLALFKKGLKEEGHKMLLKALDIDPNNGDAHVNIAMYYCDRHDSEKAWAHIQKAQKLNARVGPELLKEMRKECLNNK